MTPTVIYADPHEGYHVVPPDHDLATSTKIDELVLVATPCPARNISAPGGQMMTACGRCGQMMAGTGGTRHDGWLVVPMNVVCRTDFGDGRVLVELRWFQP